MFPKGYFPKSYFPGTYFAPSAEQPAVPPTYYDSGGGRRRRPRYDLLPPIGMDLWGDDEELMFWIT